MRPDSGGTRAPVTGWDVGWMVVVLAIVAAMVIFAHRDGIPLPLISLGFPALCCLALVWHFRRCADAERARVSAENGQRLAIQRRFLQDASHQLRTPITIALGHAELLARELAGRDEQRDIHVVVGELTRLKRLSERLLVIAASEDPEFLIQVPVELDVFVTDALRRWRPTAARSWTIGQLDAVTVAADTERLRLALDALLENAVQHTSPGDAIRLSVVRDHGGVARLTVADTGEGIPPGELDHIFERFRSGLGSHGTGLGLALVRAVALGHGGEVLVHSTPGAGSSFEFTLPLAPGANAPPGSLRHAFGNITLP